MATKIMLDAWRLPTVSTIRTPAFANMLAFLYDRSNEHYEDLLAFIFL